jgi:hypothetical protein
VALEEGGGQRGHGRTLTRALAAFNGPRPAQEGPTAGRRDHRFRTRAFATRVSPSKRRRTKRSPLATP